MTDETWKRHKSPACPRTRRTRAEDLRQRGAVQVIELDQAEMASGVYAAGLVVDGIPLGSAKFEVIR